MSEATPMMRQYRRIKQEHRDAVLFFRLGDFYEMFDRDAREVSSLLNLTLTKRNGVPMCGIPYHASRGYIARLLRSTLLEVLGADHVRTLRAYGVPGRRNRAPHLQGREGAEGKRGGEDPRGIRTLVRHGGR